MGTGAITVLAIVGIAVVGHVAFVAASPYVMMARQMRIYLRGAPINEMPPGRTADAANRTAARGPNADMMMSNGVYDLRGGPLVFSSPVPRDRYWSVSFYGANSACFFVVNQQRLGWDSVTILLTSVDDDRPAPDGALVARSPSRRGMVTIRQVIPNAQARPEVAALQDQATLRALTP